MKDIHVMQALINGLGAEWQRERAETQMTLGEMVDALKLMPSEKEINGLGDLNSYRGYYVDLAFEPTSEPEPAGTLLARCKEAMGEVFVGYKGGDYVMGANTPLWLADYGSCGDKIISIRDDGSVEVEKDD